MLVVHPEPGYHRSVLSRDRTFEQSGADGATNRWFKSSGLGWDGSPSRDSERASDQSLAAPLQSHHQLSTRKPSFITKWSIIIIIIGTKWSLENMIHHHYPLENWHHYCTGASCILWLKPRTRWFCKNPGASWQYNDALYQGRARPGSRTDSCKGPSLILDSGW